MLGGYEQDRSHVMLADTRCSIVDIVHDPAGRVLLHHSCAATRGVSGAPLLVRTGEGRWIVAGVATLAAPSVSGGYAVPVATIGKTP